MIIREINAKKEAELRRQSLSCCCFSNAGRDANTEFLAIEVDEMCKVADAEWVVFDEMEEWEVVETARMPGFSLIPSSGQK